MRSLTSAEWKGSASDGLHAVFESADPFAPSVPANVAACTLLFPVTRRLSAQQVSAVSSAARATGETEVCVTLTEASTAMGGQFDRGPHLVFAIDRYEEAIAESPIAVLENALYAVSGTWGMLFSNEDHAIAAGSVRFVETLLSKWPTPLESIDAFAEHWTSLARDDGRDVSWLESLLRQITAPPPTS